MSKNNEDSLFDMFTREGNKEEEEAYETGIIVAGVILAIIMASLLVVYLIDGGIL